VTIWLERLYEKLWRKVGGRPWTEIIRDEQKQAPLLFLLIFLGMGLIAGKLVGKYCVADTARLSAGHTLRAFPVVNIWMTNL